MIATSTINHNKFLVDNVLLNPNKTLSSETLSKLALLKREKIRQPVIYIGSNTCGKIAGAEITKQAVQQYLADRKIRAEIVEVGCIGICSEEPLMDVQLPDSNRICMKQVTEEKVSSILDDIFHHIVPSGHVLGQYEGDGPWSGVPLLEDHDFFRMQSRLLLAKSGVINPVSIEEYIANDGYTALIKAISIYTRDEICDIVEESELKGRAGGGFSTGKKWKIARNASSDQKYVICNAQESDPGAFMDRALIESLPHQLIEGLAIAAYAIGATRAIIYIRQEYTLAIKRLQEALDQATEYGLLGHNIFNSGFNLDIIIKKGPGAFVCGEETALIGSLEGKRGMPQTKPPYPAVSGFHKKPTIINNVESLSNVSNIIRNGPRWFHSLGTENSKGTKIFALSGKIKNAGLLEVQMGTTLREIIFDIGKGIRDEKKFKALQIGGPSGYCLSADHLDLKVDFDELKEKGFSIGSGGITVFDESTCMVDVTKYFMDFMQKQSCGKCIPCREGSKRMLEILDSISKKPVDSNGHAALERFKGVMQLETIAEVMKDTSLCGLGQNAPNPVMTALKWFRDEFEEHIFDRKCRANMCKELRTYYIDVDSCTGCTMCAKKCPVNAIIGTERHPFFIVQEKCISCGICMDACKFEAISID